MLDDFYIRGKLFKIRYIRLNDAMVIFRLVTIDIVDQDKKRMQKANFVSRCVFIL